VDLTVIDLKGDIVEELCGHWRHVDVRDPRTLGKASNEREVLDV
jgi:hypothetical protein